MAHPCLVDREFEQAGRFDAMHFHIDWIELTGLRVNDASADLLLKRDHRNVRVKVLCKESQIAVRVIV